MKLKCRSFWFLGAVLVGLGNVSARAEWPPAMSVSPACPSEQDVVWISLGGEWGSTCTPSWVEVDSISGYQIDLKVVLDYPPGTMCLPILVPWGPLSNNCGPLEHGTYSVFASCWWCYDGWCYLEQCPPTLAGTFIVHPAETGDLNCDGTVDFADINPFVAQLSDFEAWQAEFPGCPPQNGDINGDGTYGQWSFEDINPFVELLISGEGACP